MKLTHSVYRFSIVCLGVLAMGLNPDDSKGQELQPVEFVSLPGWTLSLPDSARQDRPGEATSYALDADFMQQLGDGEATVVSVVEQSGTNHFDIWGVHPGKQAEIDPSFQGTTLERNIFLDVCGGEFDKVSAGAAVSYHLPYAAIIGSQLTQLSGTACVDWVFGAGNEGGHSVALTGSAGVVVKDSAVVLGSILGGWHSEHNREPRVTGNTSVLILNVQGKSFDESVAVEGLPPGFIIGGSAWGWNVSSSSVIDGNTSVTVDIDPDSVTGPTNFVKSIAGGSASPCRNGMDGGGNEKVLGDASVSVSAPTNVVFTAPIYAGGLFYPGIGRGSVQVMGRATLSLHGGTFANTLDSGVADMEKSIYFQGTNVLAAGASVHGFDQMYFGPGSLTLISGAVSLERVGDIRSGEGSEIRISGEAALSAVVPPGSTSLLPTITQLDGTVTFVLLASHGEIADGRAYPVAKVTDEVRSAVEGKVTGEVMDPESGRITSGATISLDGNTVMLLPLKPFIWYEGSGDWTSTSFNLQENTYLDGISSVTFKDSVYASSGITVNNLGVKHVRGLDFKNTLVTGYLLQGDPIYTPYFVVTGGGNVQATTPVRLEGNGNIEISAESVVTISDLAGNVDDIRMSDRPSSVHGHYIGNLMLDLSTNDFRINGTVYIGHAQSLQICSALPERRIGRIGGHQGSTAFIPTPTTPDAHLIFTDDIDVARVDKRGPGKVSFIHDTSFQYRLLVYEGTMVVDGSIKGCTAGKNDPVSVSPGATIRFEGVYCRNRMPKNGWLFCDAGRVELYGINPFSEIPESPNFVLTNQSTLVADCSYSGSHLKLTTVQLFSSDILITGSKPAYNSEALVCCNIWAEGDSSIRYADGASRNMLTMTHNDNREIPEGIDVAEKGVLRFAVSAKPFVKTGAGTIVAEKGAAFQDFTLQAGTLKIAAGTRTFTTAVLKDATEVDLSEDRALMVVTDAMTIDPHHLVTVRLDGRTFSPDERDSELGGYPIIRWGTRPEGTLNVVGAPEGYRFLKRETAGILRHDGSLILLK